MPQHSSTLSDQIREHQEHSLRVFWWWWNVFHKPNYLWSSPPFHSSHVGSRVTASTDGAKNICSLNFFGFFHCNSIDFFIGVVVYRCTCTEFQNSTRPWLRFLRTENVTQIACKKIFEMTTITLLELQHKFLFSTFLMLSLVLPSFIQKNKGYLLQCPGPWSSQASGSAWVYIPNKFTFKTT